MHRRFVVVRAMESAGAGVAVAAGPAIVLAVGLLWLGRDAFTLTCGALAAGAGIGLVWGVMHRPRVQDAAAEVDRQFDLADLMGTALSARISDGQLVGRPAGSSSVDPSLFDRSMFDHSGSDNFNDIDPWQSAVVAMANERAAGLSPSAVVLRRYGARQWGGIGLSAALVLTLGLVSTLPDDRPARAAEGLMGNVVANVAPAEVIGPSSGMTRADNGGESENRSSQALADMARESAANADNVSSSAGAKVSAPAASIGQSGDGERSTSASPPRDEKFNPASGVGRSDQGGEIAGGNGSSGETAQGGGRGDGNDRGIVGGNAASAESASPWRASSWGADRTAAMRDVQSGRVPDAYRDIVRRYFRPETPAAR